jgi:glucose dehydrogenase
MGGKNQQPVAFSPRTNLIYVPTNNLCMDYEGVQVKYQAGQPYVGAIVVSLVSWLLSMFLTEHKESRSER